MLVCRIPIVLLKLFVAVVFIDVDLDKPPTAVFMAFIAAVKELLATLPPLGPCPVTALPIPEPTPPAPPPAPTDPKNPWKNEEAPFASLNVASFARTGSIGVRDSATLRKAFASPIAVLANAWNVEELEIVLTYLTNTTKLFSDGRQSNRISLLNKPIKLFR